MFDAKKYREALEPAAFIDLEGNVQRGARIPSALEMVPLLPKIAKFREGWPESEWQEFLDFAREVCTLNGLDAEKLLAIPEHGMDLALVDILGRARGLPKKGDAPAPAATS